MTLFSSYRLAGLPLANRVVMAPMTRSRAQSEIADQATVTYYRQRATAGLIITEGVPISREAIGYSFLPGLSTDAQVAGWSEVTNAVHKGGGRIFTQLWHVGRVSHAVLQPNGQPPVSSTDAAAQGDRVFAYGPREDGTIGFLRPSQPRALATDEVPRVISDYAEAALYALAAGFDGVEIHAAHGYLMEQFLNPGINQRTDRYGGSIEARSHLLLDTVDAISAIVGVGRLGVRLSPNATLLGAPSYEENSATYFHVAAELGRRGLAYLHLSDTGARTGTPAVTDALLRRTREVFPNAVVLAGGLDQSKAERLIGAGLIDLAAFGQPFISNPDLVERMRRGWPVTTPDRDTYYGGGAAGYTDYPVYAATTPAAAPA